MTRKRKARRDPSLDSRIAGVTPLRLQVVVASKVVNMGSMPLFQASLASALLGECDVIDPIH